MGTIRVLIFIITFLFFSNAYSESNQLVLFKQEFSKLLSRKSISLEHLEKQKILALSLIDLQTNNSISINGDHNMCAASLGKVSCSIAAAELIEAGDLELLKSRNEISKTGVVTSGDLQAMMQVSSNSAAHRVCSVVNEVGSPGFSRGQSSCYSNDLMDALNINENGKGILNINLFKGGKDPKCSGDIDRFLSQNTHRKTTNIGTANGFARAFAVIYSNPSWDKYDWLHFNPKHRGRDIDEYKSVSKNRFVSAFHCANAEGYCPIISRKSGSLGASKNWDYCLNDSIILQNDDNYFSMALLCNERQKKFCTQQLFDLAAMAFNSAFNSNAKR